MSCGAVELGEVVGQGAMGAVRLGNLDGRSVAFKVLDPEHLADPRRVSAFRTEARAMATVAHPHLVRVLALGSLEDGTPWVAMDRADGNLRTECGRHDWATVRTWIRQLLEGLGHAHARGIIHRDLKPANVLVFGGSVAIADFGLAHAFESLRLGRHEKPAGTPGYMPPEQRQGRWRDVGPWTDLYALGRVAIDLVTRADGTTTLVPAGFASWVSTCRQEDPFARFRRAADALAAFDTLEEDATTELDERLAGLGPAQDSSVAMTELLFDDQDELAVALPAPMERVRPMIPLQPLELADARPADGMVDLRLGRPGVSASLLQQLWDALCDAADRPVLVSLDGPDAAQTAMWLCHQAHETGVGTVELATHDRDCGPHHGLSGMVAREVRALGLDPSRTWERARDWLRGRGDPATESALRTWVAVMEPALGGDLIRPVTVDEAQRFEVADRLVAADAEGRIPVIWLAEIQHATETLEWVRHRIQHGLPGLMVATGPLVDLPEGAIVLDLPDGEGSDGIRVLSPAALDEEGVDLRVVAAAAVLSREVNGRRWEDVVRRARLPWTPELGDRLVDLGVAIPIGLGGGGDWRFVSGAFRSAILESVGREQRADLHAAAADSYPMEAASAVVRARHLANLDVDAAVKLLTQALPALAIRGDAERLRRLGDTLRELSADDGGVAWALGEGPVGSSPHPALVRFAVARAREHGDAAAWALAIDRLPEAEIGLARAIHHVHVGSVEGLADAVLTILSAYEKDPHVDLAVEAAHGLRRGGRAAEARALLGRAAELSEVSTAMDALEDWLADRPVRGACLAARLLGTDPP